MTELFLNEFVKLDSYVSSLKIAIEETNTRILELKTNKNNIKKKYRFYIILILISLVIINSQLINPILEIQKSIVKILKIHEAPPNQVNDSLKVNINSSDSSFIEKAINNQNFQSDSTKGSNQNNSSTSILKIFLNAITFLLLFISILWYTVKKGNIHKELFEEENALHEGSRLFQFKSFILIYNSASFLKNYFQTPSSLYKSKALEDLGRYCILNNLVEYHNNQTLSSSILNLCDKHNWFTISNKSMETLKAFNELFKKSELILSGKRRVEKNDIRKIFFATVSLSIYEYIRIDKIEEFEIPTKIKFSQPSDKLSDLAINHFTECINSIDATKFPVISKEINLQDFFSEPINVKEIFSFLLTKLDKKLDHQTEWGVRCFYWTLVFFIIPLIMLFSLFIFREISLIFFMTSVTAILSASLVTAKAFAKNQNGFPFFKKFINKESNK